MSNELHRFAPAVPPKSVSIDHQAAGPTFSYRWYSPKFIFLLIFCIVWDGFLVAWYLIAFSTDFEAEAVFFPLIHVAVGLVLTYYTVAGFINRTLITISHGQLTVHHAPMPWFGNRTLQTSEIGQLYREEVTQRESDGTTRSYRLNAEMRDGRKVKLVAGFLTPEAALYLEQQIEQWLGIKDVRVPGEMPKQRRE